VFGLFTDFASGSDNFIPPYWAGNFLSKVTKSHQKILAPRSLPLRGKPKANATGVHFFGYFLCHINTSMGKESNSPAGEKGTGRVRKKFKK